MKISNHCGHNLWECRPLALYTCTQIPMGKTEIGKSF
jgi:hypothetical protein